MINPNVLTDRQAALVAASRLPYPVHLSTNALQERVLAVAEMFLLWLDPPFPPYPTPSPPIEDGLERSHPVEKYVAEDTNEPS